VKDSSRKVIQLLKDILVMYPYLRVGQVIENQLKENEVLFYMSDEKLYERLIEFEKLLKEGNTK